MAPEATSKRTILVGWDGSEQARDALELATLLARVTDASLTVATVVADRLGVLRRTERHEALVREAEERLASASLNGSPGPAVSTRVVTSSTPGHGLHDLAEELSAATIVLGSTHRGVLGRVFPGTVADDLLSAAPCEVAVAPRGYGRRYGSRLLRIIVAAFDVSPESQAAVRVAADLARAAGARLKILAVLQPPVQPVGPDASYSYASILDAEEAHLNEEVARVAKSVDPAVDCDAGVVVQGDPALVLADETEEAADLLVVGSRGYGPLGRVLLDGVASKLVRTAGCPVLVVPRRGA